jgi:iron complex outermembrane receptor protein
VNDYFSFQLAGSWIDTEVTDVPAAVCVDCDGNKLSQQPKVVLTGFASFNYPTSFGEFQANADFRYQDDIYGGLANEEHNRWGSYTNVSARVGYAFENGWGAWAYVDNLLDELYYGGGTSGGYPFPQLVFGTSAPRSFGLIVRYEYGD